LRRKGTISALEALRDALYKSTTTTATATTANRSYGVALAMRHQILWFIHLWT